MKVFSKYVFSLSASILLSLTIACGGGSSAPPLQKDLTPNAFSFAEVTNAEVSSVVESESVTISGVDEAVSVSISGGEYSIDGGNYTSGSGSIDSGQTIQLRVTASENFATDIEATVMIGGVSGIFIVTTKNDTTPNAFSFIPQTEVSPESSVESNSVTISGITDTAPVNISGGEYAIDGGDFTSVAGTISNGQSVVVRLTASAQPETTSEATLTVGDVEAVFSVTTEGMYNFEGFTGAALNARLQTHIVEINNIGDSTPISIENGEYQLDRGEWTAQNGFINNGQEVRVRALAGDDYNITTTAKLTIGESWGFFSITTKEHGDFISVWKTDNPGVSDDNQITLPLEETGFYDFTVDWGDGTSDNIIQWDQAELTHTYAEAGTYTVVIRGDIDGFRFNNEGDEEKIIEVQHWGALRLGNNGGAFFGAENLVFSGSDALDLREATNLSRTFSSTLKSGNQFNGYLGNWDLSSVENAESMLSRTHTFNGDISRWDVSSIQNMEYMLAGMDSFNTDISEWDVSSVTNMRYTFNAAKSFNGDISRWDVSSVTDMEGAFFYSTVFDGDLSSWNVSSVTSMRQIFTGSGLSTENYSNALIGWSQLPGIQSNVSLDADNIYYNAPASEAREFLRNSKDWSFRDGGPEPIH
ncbi:BspA family leucine-rich repeat surface protein [Aliikangiella sp. G2MR2-5]|uniref:BspA family leucine-rich repeat surface protein n=1 Tax=Aliikangiella sp. G2MR2-5 TaxID=2788943 RepID=UPI0018A89A9E|nr:BspA family leucine-rich repeat surface protein [Aliikangiella sp. G2MR2-5]